MTDANRLLHLTLALALLAATSCGNSIENDVDLLYEGGPKAQEARKHLSQVRPIDTRSLIEAFRDTRHPAYVRLDLGAALVLLFEREKNRRVLYTLIEAIADPEAEIRAAIAETLRSVDFDRRKAAAVLDIGLSTLYRKEKEYGLRQSPNAEGEA